MDILPVSKVDNISPVVEKKSKKTELQNGLSFSEILNNLQQRELSSKIASGTNVASKPAAVNFPSIDTSSVVKKQANILNSRLNGDFTSSFALENPTEADKARTPQGSAAGTLAARDRTIDRTSKLYEQALELESYFVKIMINTMKNTLSGNIFGKDSYATKMYRDMIFDELSRVVTKNANFGLADQIYLELT